MGIEELKGKVIIEISGAEKDSEEIIFICNDGKRYKMFHYQDCCEAVYIADVAGEIESLIGSPIIRADEVTDDGKTEWGTCTWTFYKLATAKGYVTIRWYGESNGYYSESVDFEEISRGEK